MTLRITLATFDDAPPLGGQGVLARDLRAALRRRGVAVRTVAGRGASVVPFPAVVRRPPLDLSLLLNRRPELLLVGDPSLVHVMGGPGGILLVRRPGVPVVYTANHTYRQAFRRGTPQRALAALEAVAYRRARAVLAISASTAAEVRAMGVAARRVEVVPPGVDAAAIAEVASRAVREPGRLLFVGRLEAEKGALDAVAVMAAVCRRCPSARGAVVGRGRQTAAVRAAADEVPGGRVSFLGALDDGALALEYGRASVVVVPSRYEGLGLVALEAFSAGAAVVGYDVTGLRDAVGDAGVLVPFGDRRALVESVVALLGDEPRRADAAARGRARVLAGHSWDATAARVEAVYRSVIGEG